MAILILLAAIIGSYWYISKNKSAKYEFIIATKGDIIQEISATGRIKPSQSVNLAFERSGKVASIYAKVGNKIKENNRVIALNSADLALQLLQAQANWDSEEAKLQELEKGTRPEELQATQTKVANAQKTLEDAEINLQNIKNKADADLKSIYDGGLTAAQKSATIAKNSLLVLTEIQYKYFLENDENGNKLAEAKSNAMYAFLGAQNAGRLSSEFVAKAEGGIFGVIKNAIIPPYDEIDTMLVSLNTALQTVKTALDTIPITSQLISTDKTNINAEKNNTVAEMTIISGKQQSIAVQKMVNNYSISSAEATVNSAKNALLSTKDELAIKQASATVEQIAGQEAKVKSMAASVENIQLQIKKSVLYSPINGTITRQDAKVGEIVIANAPIVSIISDAEFEIETYIPEADIAKTQIGNLAKITLDAYGDSVIFEAKVVEIDPAETILEGVATYKTKLQFLTKDNRIKSGMTANISIITSQRQNVIVIPQRLVITINEKKFIKVLNDDNTIEDRKIKMGIRDLLGNVEIIEGINEGDRLLIEK